MYKLEDLRFLNSKIAYSIGVEKIREIEVKFTREEKISLIDELYNGFASYMLGIFDKYNEDIKDGIIKCDSYGKPKNISLKAWQNRNQKDNILTYNHYISCNEYGYYRFLGNMYKISDGENSECHYGVVSYDLLFKRDIVSEWFHQVVKSLVSKENLYMQTQNPYYIKLNRVKEIREYEGNILNSTIVDNIFYNGYEPKEEILDNILSAIEEVKDFRDNIKKKYNIKDNDVDYIEMSF